MRYLTEIGQKWSESGALFIAAFLSSFFLLFILIEPFLSSFYQLKQDLEGTTIQAHIRSESQKPQNPSANELQKEVSTRQPSEKEGLVPSKPPIQQDNYSPSPSINPTASLDNFAFNVAPYIESPSSAPILGGRSGLRSKAPSAPGPKKNRDSISDEALATYRNQTGQEVDKRHAQAELAQLMNSLEAQEEYQCTIRKDGGSNPKTPKENIGVIAQCKPSTPKAAFLEWVIKRLFVDEACANISASQPRGLQKKGCGP